MELLHTESTSQRCIDYVDIAGRSSARSNLVSRVLHTKAVARLPLCQLDFLVYIYAMKSYTHIN